MAEEIAFENGRISNFEGLMTFTFTYVWRTHGRTFETGFISSTLLKSVGLPKMKTRHPVEGSFGSEFPAFCNRCGVMAA